MDHDACPAGRVSRSRPEPTDSEDDPCLIRLEHRPIFAWRECNHFRPPIRSGRKSVTEKPFRNYVDAGTKDNPIPCVYCRQASALMCGMGNIQFENGLNMSKGKRAEAIITDRTTEWSLRPNVFKASRPLRSVALKARLEVSCHSGHGSGVVVPWRHLHQIPTCGWSGSFHHDDEWQCCMEGVDNDVLQHFRHDTTSLFDAFL